MLFLSTRWSRMAQTGAVIDVHHILAGIAIDRPRSRLVYLVQQRDDLGIGGKAHGKHSDKLALGVRDVAMSQGDEGRRATNIRQAQARWPKIGRLVAARKKLGIVPVSQLPQRSSLDARQNVIGVAQVPAEDTAGVGDGQTFIVAARHDTDGAVFLEEVLHR